MKTLYTAATLVSAVLIGVAAVAQDGPPQCQGDPAGGPGFRRQRGGPEGFQGQRQGFRGQGGPRQGIPGQRGGPGGPSQGFRGQGGGPGGPQAGRRAGGPNPEVLKKAGATDDQLEQLKKLHQAQEIRQVELKAAAEKAQVTLKQLMSEPGANEKDVLKAVDAVTEAKAALMKQGISARFKAREILGEEIGNKLREMAPKGPGPDGAPGIRGQGAPEGGFRGPRGRVNAGPGGPPAQADA